MRQVFYALIAMCTVCILTGAQWDEADEQKALQFTAKAVTFFDNGQYDSALSYYLKAEKLYVHHPNHKMLADCKNSIAEVYRLLSDTDHALEYSEAVITLCTENFPGSSEMLGKAYEVIGKVYDYNIRDFEKASQYYQKAFTIWQGLYGKEHSTIAENYFLQGRIFLNTGKFDKAGFYFKEAEQMKLKLVGSTSLALYDLYLGEATLNRRLLKFDEALRYYKLAQEVCIKNHRSEDHPSFGLLAYGMGNLYIEKGQYEDAIHEYKQAVKNFLKCYGENDFHMATAYANIGAAYSNQLDFDEAEQYYNKALAIYRIIMEEDHPFISNLYVDFCDLYFSAGRFEESIQNGKKAIELFQRRYHDEPTRELGIASFYTSNSLLQAGKFQEALLLINKSIAVLQKMGEKYLLSNAYATRGTIYDALGEFSLSEKDFIQAIQSLGEEENNLHLAFAYRAFATHSNELKKFDKALALTNQGLAQLGLKFKDQYELPSLEGLYIVDYLSELLPARGTALLGIYKTSHQKDILLAALENYKALTQVYQRIIQENKAERSKLLQLPNLVVYYERAVVCALELYNQTNEITYKHKAFEFAEQSKAVLLLQYVHDTKAKKFAGIPEEIIREEKTHKEKISHLEATLAELSGQQADDSVVVPVQKDLFDAKAFYAAFLDKLEKDYPSYYALKYNRQNINAEVYMKTLAKGEAIVEYLIGNENIYIFLMSAKEVDIITLKQKPEIEKYAEGIRSALIEKNMNEYANYASAFYQEMFQPAETFLKRNQISSITIIPDGFVSYVPIEALIKNITSINESKKYIYLLEDYTIHYQYSASLIVAYRAFYADPKANSDFVGFAPSFTKTNHDALNNLAYNKEEVIDIQKQIDGDKFVDEEASETNFKKLSSDYGIIHLATHAVMDDNHADLSRLYFSTSTDSIEDGRLYAYELFNMKIPAQLITLSACNTGMGKFHRGEGVMSLSRAFAYAGCPSIVTSLWEAQDKSTALLMKFFYENLSNGMAKDESLRQAKLRFINESDKIKRNPFFWAGFILVGDETPIEHRNKNIWWIAMIGVIILLGSMIYVYRKMK